MEIIWFILVVGAIPYMLYRIIAFVFFNHVPKHDEEAYDMVSDWKKKEKEDETKRERRNITEANQHKQGD